MRVHDIIADFWQALQASLKKYWYFIQYVLAGLVFFLIGATLYANWSDLSSLDWKLNYLWFSVSLLLVSGSILSLAIWWTLSIRFLQGQLGWEQGIRIWTYAQLAKYLPGGVWNYVSRVYACDRVGVPKSCTTLSLAIETILRIQAAIVVFLASLPFWPASEWSDAKLPLFVFNVLLAGLLALNPHFLNKGLNIALRVMNKPPISVADVKYKHILGLLAGHILTVSGVGGAFYLMVIAIYPVPLAAAFPMAGMLSLSVISGFLNPLTPHGLGTREGLLVFFLANYLPVPIAIVISLLSRLWLTLSELLGVLVATFVFQHIPNSWRLFFRALYTSSGK